MGSDAMWYTAVLCFCDLFRVALSIINYCFLMMGKLVWRSDIMIGAMVFWMFFCFVDWSCY